MLRPLPAARSGNPRHPIMTVESRSGPRFSRHRMAATLVLATVVGGFSPGASAGEITSGQNEPQNGANVELPWLARDKFDRVRFMNEASSHFLYGPTASQPKVLFIFLPPPTPPLDSELPVLAPLDAGPLAPPELAAFVSDFFYPFLAARLATDDLPKPLRARIVAYRDAKTAIINELRVQIAALKELDESAAQRRLEELSTQQASRISEVALQAEALREELRHVGLFGFSGGELDPEGKLGGPIRAARDTPSTPAEALSEAQLLRAAAYYQEGLAGFQRRLLVEAADDLVAGTRVAPPGTRIVAFSPEPARIPLPLALEPGLARKIDDYLAQKDALKSELRDTLHDLRSSGSGEGDRLLTRLAAKQTPRMAAVEALAEDIRRDLAKLPGLKGPPAPPALPPDIASRITAYRSHKVELLKTLRTMLAAPTPTARPGGTPEEAQAYDPAAKAQAWLHDNRSTTEVQSSNLRVSVADFDRLQNDLVSTLNAEEAGIRERLAAYARSTNGPADRKSINDLLKDFENARLQQETWDRYRDYQAATVLPGLSPGQRRLLLDAGIEQLGLALPAGERVN